MASRAGTEERTHGLRTTCAGVVDPRVVDVPLAVLDEQARVVVASPALERLVAREGVAGAHLAGFLTPASERALEARLRGGPGLHVLDVEIDSEPARAAQGARRRLELWQPAGAHGSALALLLPPAPADAGAAAARSLVALAAHRPAEVLAALPRPPAGVARTRTVHVADREAVAWMWATASTGQASGARYRLRDGTGAERQAEEWVWPFRHPALGLLAYVVEAPIALEAGPGDGSLLARGLAAATTDILVSGTLEGTSTFHVLGRSRVDEDVADDAEAVMAQFWAHLDPRDRDAAVAFTERLGRGEGDDLCVRLTPAPGRARRLTLRARPHGAGAGALTICHCVDTTGLDVAAEPVGAGPAAAPATTALLSARQLEILALVAEGLRNAEIGARLYLAEATVRNHLSATYERLGVSSRSEAIAAALRLGLLR